MRRAARAAPPSIGAAVICAAKPEDVALPAAEEAPLTALESRLEADEATDDADEAAEETAPDKEEEAEVAAPDADEMNPPTGVKRVVEPMVEVATALLPDETVVKMAAAKRLLAGVHGLSRWLQLTSSVRGA